MTSRKPVKEMRAEVLIRMKFEGEPRQWQGFKRTAAVTATSRSGV